MLARQVGASDSCDSPLRRFWGLAHDSQALAGTTCRKETCPEQGTSGKRCHVLVVHPFSGLKIEEPWLWSLTISGGTLNSVQCRNGDGPLASHESVNPRKAGTWFIGFLAEQPQGYHPQTNPIQLMNMRIPKYGIPKKVGFLRHHHGCKSNGFGI